MVMRRSKGRSNGRSSAMRRRGKTRKVRVSRVRSKGYRRRESRRHRRSRSRRRTRMKGGMVGEKVEKGVEGRVFQCPSNLEEYKGNGVDDDDSVVTKDMLRTVTTVSLLSDRLSFDYTISRVRFNSSIKYDQIRNVGSSKREYGRNWLLQHLPGRSKEFEDTDLIRIDGGDEGKKLTLSFPRGVYKVKRDATLHVYPKPDVNSTPDKREYGSIIKLHLHEPGGFYHDASINVTFVKTSNPYASDRKGDTGWVRNDMVDTSLEKTDFYREFCNHLRPKVVDPSAWRLESDTE